MGSRFLDAYALDADGADGERTGAETTRQVGDNSSSAPLLFMGNYKNVIENHNRFALRSSPPQSAARPPDPRPKSILVEETRNN
jgi:hypothetical protein